MKAIIDNKWFDKVRVNSWEIEILIVACILVLLFIFTGRDVNNKERTILNII